jgi:hypothetical protein
MSIAPTEEALLMVFKRNVPGWERLLRAALGIVLLLAAFAVPMQAWLAWVLSGSGIGALASALMGFCPACALAGRRLPGA